MYVEFVTGNGSEQNPYYFPSEADMIWRADIEDVTEALNYLMYMLKNEKKEHKIERKVGEYIFFRTFNSVFKAQVEPENGFGEVTEVIPASMRRDERVEQLFSEIRQELLPKRPRL